MEYYSNFQKLLTEFKSGVDFEFSDTDIQVRFYNFISGKTAPFINEDILSDMVEENISFHYPVFINKKKQDSDRAILLLHGLNERNWNKYLTWSEYLCRETGKPVILFPIAFHVNRSPLWWSNPRILRGLIDKRKIIPGNESSVSFANFALSERITENPNRFYLSGQQSVSDLTGLLTTIYEGEHPLFEKYTGVDVFAYSIGAFLSQILFMLNPSGLLENSKLFMFCGGSIFSRMFGQSKSIMDKTAFEKLYHYYTEDFYKQAETVKIQDKTMDFFSCMLREDNNKAERTAFFRNLKKRFSGIALKNDIVIPYNGITEALGVENSKNIEMLDFGYKYTHENPFPVFQNEFSEEVNFAFNTVFNKASAFLA